MIFKHEKRLKPPVGNTENPDSMYHHMVRFLAYLEERNYSRRTVEIREEHLRSFISWCFERSLICPHELDRPTLERFQRHLFYYRKSNGEPMAVASQQGILTSIRQWLKWLVKKGHLLYSPAADLDLPRTEKRLPKAILTAREAELVLAVPDVETTAGIRDRAILETFYSTGMRRMELDNLRIHDLDFERGTVMIRQGKGKKDRMIPIGDRALAWITAYLDRSRPKLLGGRDRDEGILFLHQGGGRFGTERLSDLVTACVDKADIGKKGSCHLFRHTMATLMLENGADIRFIQEMLGHAKLETTQVYTKVSIRQLKAVHLATHPGRMAEVGRHAIEGDEQPSPDDAYGQKLGLV